MLHRLLLALFGLFVSLPAWGQGATVYQAGTMVPGHLAKFVSQGRIADIGGILGDPTTGLGASPFGVTDNNGLGICSYSGPTTKAYTAFCIGHDANGNALLTVSGGGELSLDLNGSIFTFPGAGNGNVIGPTNPTPSANHVALWNGGTSLKDGGLPALIVPDNASLAASSITAYPTGVYRKCYSNIVCADPLWFVPQTGLCAVNALVNDGGNCVDAPAGNSWKAVWPSDGMNIRQWGAVGDGVADDGIPLRAACKAAYGTRLPVVLPVASVGYLVKTLDASGFGAIVVGTGLTGAAAVPCHFKGTGSPDYADSCYSGAAPAIKLAANLNRPLVYVRKNTQSPLWENLCLDGNRTEQGGWAGGPSGKLYTVQIEDDVGAAIDASIRFDHVVVMGGYNGNIYLGSGRGGGWWKDTWFSYSGQSSADYAVYLQGYDCVLTNVAIGSNTGNGIFFVSGSQYQMTDGAVFLNFNGISVNGNKVNYLNIKGTNVQANGGHGVQVFESAPFPGSVGGIHVYDAMTFDNNSNSANGTYSDFTIGDGNTVERIIAPGFFGAAATAQNRAKYNVEIAGATGNGAAYVIAPSFGSPGNISATSGFTNNYTRVRGDFPITPNWTPALVGASGGPATYVSRKGSWSINGNQVTAIGNVTVSSLGGISGATGVSGLPLPATAAANDVGICSVVPAGWTAPAGYTQMSGTISPSATQLQLFRSSNTGGAATNVLASELAAATSVTFTCTYHVDFFP